MRVLNVEEMLEVSGGCGRKRSRCGSKSWGKGSGKGSGKNSGKCGSKGSGKRSGKGSGKGCSPVPVCPPVIVIETPPIDSVP
ncbi:hypothetical protein LPB72_21975 [Hydrogenophaga crassostreae]|uniref:Bacteriocin microcin n=1 Tax=Hydrogenophaga crassostreae TaxID=1763535 RepID=A0A167GCL3_9BURK|nr:hypothetical protein [Hydrogenophaga crassostreae]AOW15178.1 hypothetical protein LPB072_22590 [Hydrogenophaga crassostreae]OAD39267.1 hypothetical protein LPB72_21975 [Hydrogenophaga crassostreae]